MTKHLILLLCLLLPLPLFAADLGAQLQFAESLAAENDHYRAITEYKRFLFLHPDSEQAPQARLAIATSLIAGKRWQEADRGLEELIRLHPQSSEARKGRQLYASIAYDRGEFSLSRDRYRELAKDEPDPEIINYSNFRTGWTFLEEDQPQKARDFFSLLPEQDKNLLLEDLEAYQGLPQKSPFIAGTLSTILPGAGQAYTGRLQQAAVSLLLNGAFILGAVEAFHNENYAVGGILLFFEIGWYGGNIYNAVNNAHKFNARVKHKYKQQMRTRLNLQLGMLKRTPLVAMQYSF